MSSPFAAEGVWHPLDYDQAWAPFNERFDFKPNFHERTEPAINLPDRSLVIDLASVFAHEGPRFAAGETAVNAIALRSFVWLADDEEMTALDWQHTPYRYSPAKHAVAELDHWPVPVFANGDYHIHLAPGLRWGTFGHPWQQSLTLWGTNWSSPWGPSCSPGFLDTLRASCSARTWPALSVVDWRRNDALTPTRAPTSGSRQASADQGFDAARKHATIGDC